MYIHTQVDGIEGHVYFTCLCFSVNIHYHRPSSSTIQLDPTRLPPNGHLLPNTNTKSQGGKTTWTRQWSEGQVPVAYPGLCLAGKKQYLGGPLWGQLTWVSGEKATPRIVMVPVDVFLVHPSNWMKEWLMNE